MPMQRLGQMLMLRLLGGADLFIYIFYIEWFSAPPAGLAKASPH